MNHAAPYSIVPCSPQNNLSTHLQFSLLGLSALLPHGDAPKAHW